MVELLRYGLYPFEPLFGIECPSPLPLCVGHPLNTQAVAVDWGYLEAPITLLWYILQGYDLIIINGLLSLH